METIIREGSLRILTSETCCDVLLSCQGYRLMAHKLMLSIASPLLHDLLLQDKDNPSVLIFPDISGNTMSLILDYIYTGRARVCSNTINDFISAAALLKLQLDPTCLDKCSNNILEDYKLFGKKEEKLSDNVNLYIKKHQKKIPKLVPICSFMSNKLKDYKKSFNCVIPSPWLPREMPLLSDPRTCYGTTTERLDVPYTRHKTDESDPNNNCRQKNIPIENVSDTTNDTSTNSSMSLETSVNTTVNTIEYEYKTTKNSLLLSNQENNESSEGTSKNPTKYKKKISYRKSAEGTQEKAARNEKHKPFKCEDCGKCFSQLRNYKYHRSVHEGTREFAAKCPECGKNFNDRGYLSSHMKIHRDKKEYACSHCPKRFNQRVAYNMHLRIHTGIKPHECTTCGKSFSRKMLLKQHQRVHTGEKPYSCPECGKTFADRSNMSLHARLHTGVKPYSCNLCSKSFTKKHHLKTHMNFHTGLKPYNCQKCGLAFSQSSNMRTHYKKCVLKNVDSLSSVAENIDIDST